MKSVYFSITPLNKAVNVYSFALVLDYLLGAFYLPLMHQSTSCAQPPPPPHPPSHPPGYCGAFARLFSPGGGAFANFALPGANPGAITELLTRKRFPIRI